MLLCNILRQMIVFCSGLSQTDMRYKWWLSSSCCTCMPHTLTPSVPEVLCSHFFICLAAFSSEASSPCCLVPIFRSRMQGYEKWWTTFSNNRNSGSKTAVTEHISGLTSEPTQCADFPFPCNKTKLTEFIKTSGKQGGNVGKQMKNLDHRSCG